MEKGKNKNLLYKQNSRHNEFFCFGVDSSINNDNEKKTTLFAAEKKHKYTKETYTEGPKSMGRKVDFVVVFTYISRRGALPEEGFM